MFQEDAESRENEVGRRRELSARDNGDIFCVRPSHFQDAELRGKWNIVYIVLHTKIEIELLKRALVSE